MNKRMFSIPRIWGTLSRTIPPSASVKQTNYSRTSLRRTTFRFFGSEFGHFVYQGLMVTGPLGLCYVVGTVVGDLGGEAITVSLLLAAITSTLSGLCYAELLTSSQQCSGNPITVTYQLVGELPSFFLAVFTLLTSVTSFAALSKALSSTMEELTHGRLSDIFSNIFGTLPVSELPPDLFAAGAALVTSFLLACGLKQAGFLRTVMNVLCFTAFVLFLSVGASHTKSMTQEEDSPRTRQILAVSGMMMCLFFHYLELGRRSKAQKNAQVELPLAISCLSVAVLFLTLALGIVLSLILDDRVSVGGAPLLKALKQRDVDWARLIVGSLQVIILGLGLSEAGDIVSKQLVTMASCGFIPSFVSKECSVSFSHSRACLLGGVWAALLALFLTHVYTIELIATSVLSTNTLVCFVIMYRPHRCAYDSLCTVAVTSSSRTFRERIRVPLPSSSCQKRDCEHRTLQFIKSGFRIIPYRKLCKTKRENEELAIPLLSSLRNEGENDDETTRIVNYYESTSSIVEEGDISSNGLQSFDVSNVVDNQENTYQTNLTSSSSPQENVVVESSQSANIKNNDLVTLAHDLESHQLLDIVREGNMSGEISAEEEEEEDVGKIVAEFKKQLQVSTTGPKLHIAPTRSSARMALLIIFGISAISFILCRLSLTQSDYMESFSSTLSSVFITVFIILDLILLVILWTVPAFRKASPVREFQVPCSPLIPFVALFLNILLMTELLSRTVWITLPLYILGALWYVAYSSRYSMAARHEATRSLDSTPKIPGNFINLAPVLPATVYSTHPQT